MAVATRESESRPGTFDRLFDPGGWQPLDDLISSAWQGLNRYGAEAECPVCEGTLVWDSTQGRAGCNDCGSVLS